MEQAITIIIYIHAFFGGLGLFTGMGSMVVKKGSKLHKSMGKIFSVSMITSCVVILPIAWMPNHKNLFLFLISLFTIYLVLIGNRALTFKSLKKQMAAPVDKILSISMLIFSIFMVFYGSYGLYTGVSNTILYVIFGGLGIFLTIKNFIFYKNYKEQKLAWLLSHITHMLSALIASVTAFIIAGLSIGNLFSWIFPSIIGTLFIIYWRRKTKGNSKVGPKMI